MRFLLIVLCLLGMNDTALLPKTNFIGSETAVLKPGGIAGRYRDAKGPYELLLVRLASNEKAAFLLLDIKKEMIDAHYLAHMGGFAGKRNGHLFYVFAKGPFVAAVQDKPEAEADAIARTFAARLPLK